MKVFDVGVKPGETLKPVPCSLCGWPRFTPVIPGYVKCSACGVVFQRVQPPQDQLSRRYATEYLDMQLHRNADSLDNAKQTLKDFGIPLGDGGRVLDVGSSIGEFLIWMKALGWTPQGIDICRETAEIAVSRGIPTYVGLLTDAPFLPSSFNLIHMAQLIEHVANPMTTLYAAKKLLAPGGTLVLSTPNWASLERLATGSNWRSLISDHLTMFTPKSITKYLEGAEFDVDRLVTWGCIPKGHAPKWIANPINSLVKALGVGDMLAVKAKHASRSRE